MDTNTLELVATNPSPFNIEYTMVICAGLRYMAYADNDGNWRNAYDNSKLPMPVQVLW